MLEKYTKEEIDKIYEELPNNLKDVLFSKETSEIIYNSCKENDLTEEKMKEVSTLVGEIILGITPINDLEKNMIRDLGIGIDKAKSISREISRFVLSPVKEEIEQAFKKNANEKVNDEDVPDRPEKKDIYREPIE